RRAPLDPGIAFAIRPMLRFAIVLLGLQVTLTEVLALGPGALALAVAVVAVTVPAAAWLGARMGVPQPLALLLGMGTGICGASAIVAANQVVRAKDEDVTYALAVITLCGTLGLVLLPLLAAPLGLDAQSYGLWAGASLHEVVQAVGAAAAGGPEAAQSGTVMKLARVMLLAPAIMALGWWVARQGAAGGTAKVQVPWFALGFLGLVLLGSTGLVPAVATEASRLLVPLLMAASVAALGLATDRPACCCWGCSGRQAGFSLLGRRGGLSPARRRGSRGRCSARCRSVPAAARRICCAGAAPSAARPRRSAGRGRCRAPHPAARWRHAPRPAAACWRVR
ncbi:MAG: hypothetical protein B7Z53_00540, partial [Rhodospirillales bacterium 12-71-4]